MPHITIKNLRLRTIIGVADQERITKQDVVLNVLVAYDFRKAAISDDIADTLDYSVLTQEITALVEASRFHLLEALCHAVIDLAASHEGVSRVEVEVDKPAALLDADSVSVSMSLQK